MLVEHFAPQGRRFTNFHYYHMLPVHAGLCLCICNPPNSDMDYRLFNRCTVCNSFARGKANTETSVLSLIQSISAESAQNLTLQKPQGRRKAWYVMVAHPFCDYACQWLTSGSQEWVFLLCARTQIPFIHSSVLQHFSDSRAALPWPGQGNCRSIVLYNIFQAKSVCHVHCIPIKMQLKNIYQYSVFYTIPLGHSDIAFGAGVGGGEGGET